MFEILNSIPFLDSVQFLINDVNNFCGKSKDIWRFVGSIVNILQIAIPVIIILLGTIDLGKAVMAGEDKKIKEAQKMLLMRLIYGVAIFFIVLIIQIVFGLLGSDKDTTSSACFSCVASPGKC